MKSRHPRAPPIGMVAATCLFLSCCSPINHSGLQSTRLSPEAMSAYQARVGDEKTHDCKQWADQLLVETPLGVRVSSHFMPTASVDQLQEFSRQVTVLHAECVRNPHAMDAAKLAYLEQIKQNAIHGY